MLRVVIVGAGVIGLSTAQHLLERFPGQLDLTVVSESFSPHTTSDKAGAITIIGSSNDQRADEWARATFRRLHSIFKSEENAKVEMSLQQGYMFFDSHVPDPWYKDEVFGFRRVQVDSLEAKLLHTPPGVEDIWSFCTYIMKPTFYLRWMMEKTKAGGVKFEQKKILYLDELSSYDVVINCTGLGSCELMGDQELYPIRGQAVLVRAPWIKHWIKHTREHGPPVYIFPRSGDVVLGGTAEVGDWNETPDPNTATEIVRNCQQLVPSLCSADVIGEWAGLRPGRRCSVRMESCLGPGDSLLVHCYGHSERGVILSWGCAQEVGDIVQKRVLQSSSNI